MEARFYIDPETGLPHIYNHGVTEAEVLQVLRKPGPVYRGDRNSRLKSGQTDAGRFLQVVYSPNPAGESVFVITAYRLTGKAAEGISAPTTEVTVLRRTTTSKSSKRRKTVKKIKQEFPPGWNERKVRAVIQHYDQLTDDELAHEIETAQEVKEETLISVPTELLPTIQDLIVRHQQSA